MDIRRHLFFHSKFDNMWVQNKTDINTTHNVSTKIYVSQTKFYTNVNGNAT